MELENQIKLALSIFSGATLDKDGYCGCPRCGSRDITHDGHTQDEGYIICPGCGFSINGYDPYEMVTRWNSINRNSFQLKIPYKKVKKRALDVEWNFLEDKNFVLE